MSRSVRRSTGGVAVVGMACIFPGAHSAEDLWLNILAGRREFRRSPPERLPLRDYYDPDPAAPGKTYCDQLAVITDWIFDPLEFGIPPVALESTDPTHWLALGCADRALADAGIDPELLDRDRAAVIVGNSLGGEFARSLYLGLRLPFAERALERALARGPELPQAARERLVEEFRRQYLGPLPAVNEDSLAGTMSNTIAGRICNHFDLGGGGFTVDGACSSSLLAVAHACSALTEGEFDVVLSGGVDISLDPYELVGFAKAQALAKRDIRPYDASAEGMIPGEGCGIFVLMREEDAVGRGLPVRAVIRGWGYSSDGTAGMTAPRREGQVRAIRRAYERAGYPLSSVDLIEGHGTGTVLGDQVELRALAEALEEESPTPAEASASSGAVGRRSWVGSVKGNIGHCKAAAGSAGLIKAVMALERGILPPSSGCSEPHPFFRRPASRLAPALEGRLWCSRSGRRRAGVSGFGFGGANAHITLEEGNTRPASPLEVSVLVSDQASELVLVSATGAAELAEKVDHLRALASRVSRAELRDLAAELVRRDRAESHRLAVVSTSPWHLGRALDRIAESLAAGRSVAELGDASAGVFSGQLEDGAEPGPVVMMFPGQGTQRPGMARDLVRRYPEVAELGEELDRALSELLPGGVCSWLDFDERLADRGDLERARDRIRATQIAQPTIVAASLLTLRALERFGLSPSIVLGHSLGMISALAAKGAFDPSTAVQIAALRGRAMAELDLADPGAMVAIAAGAPEVSKLVGEVGGQLAISNFNSPRQTVVSGTSAAVGSLAELGQSRGLSCRLLPVSHAFHSALVAPATAVLRRELERVAMAPPESTVISTMSGEPLAREADLRALLSDHIGQPVRFAPAVERAARSQPCLWLEVGPGAVQCGFVRDILADSALICLTTDAPGKDVFDQLNAVLGQAYCLGLKLCLERLFERRFCRTFDYEGYSPRFIVNPCERIAPPERRWAGGELAELDEPVSETESAEEDEGQTRERALRFAMSWIEHRTGHPRAGLRPEMRLRSDLNLDSIKAAELVQALVARDRAELRPVPGLENASIGELVDAVVSSRGAAPTGGLDELVLASGAALGGNEEGSDWSHAFRVEAVEAPLAAERELTPLESIAVAVVGSSRGRRTRSVVSALAEAGMAPFATTAGRLLELPGQAVDAGAVVWLLPSETSVVAEPDAERFDRRLDRSTSVLRRMARWVLASSGKPGGRPRWLVARADGSPGGYRAAASGAALLKSLRQEFPGLEAKWIDLPASWTADRFASVVVDEFQRGGARVHYRYSADGARSSDACRLVEDTTRGRGPGLGEKDVVLVSGGGSGVTAVLAKTLGEECRSRLVLFGRSPAETPAVRETLEVMRAAGVSARYARCDVTDREAIARLVRRVQRQLGPVTAILHGADSSRPTPFDQLTGEAYDRSIAVKAGGLYNLLSVCPPQSLKALHVVSSVIAHTGMAKQADYALANAWLEGAIAELSESFPAIHAVSLAYTLWRESGRGPLLGNLELLQEIGITAIDDAAGAASYRSVLRGELPSGRLVYTGRLSPGLESALQPPPPEGRGRYLEVPLRWIPGVELACESALSLERDLYLRDHVIAGTPILPAVMGIEAMVSAAMACTGRADLPVVSDLAFRRAVVVPEGATLAVRVLARVLGDRREWGERIRVRVALRGESDGFAEDLFSGLCTFAAAGSRAGPVAARREPPRTSPEVDLLSAEQFAPDLLFQGPSFRSLLGFWEIESKEGTLAALRVPPPSPCFSAELPERLCTPSPALRDGFLQAALPILERPGVAVEIRELRSFQAPEAGADIFCRVRRVARRGARTEVDIEAFDFQGRLVETLLGVVFEPVRRHAPAVPLSHDELVAELAHRWVGEPLCLSLETSGEPPGDGVVRRREVSRLNTHAARAAAVEFAGRHRGLRLEPEAVRIERDGEGRPHLGLADVHDGGLAGVGVSLADAGGLSVAVVGPRRVGVDVEPIEWRRGEAWRRLLGRDGYALALRIGGKTGEPFSIAATRVWTVLEACLKALGRRPCLDRCRISSEATWVSVTSDPVEGWSCLNARIRARPDVSLPAVALTVACGLRSSTAELASGDAGPARGRTHAPARGGESDPAALPVPVR